MFACGPAILTPANGRTYLLDSYTTNVWAICSLRLRLTAYAGNAIRVRRSSDNAEVDIGFMLDGTLDISGLAAHVGAGSGYITKWYDQSGSGNDFVQATTTNQPRIVNAGTYDGKLVFDGSNDQLASSAVSGTPTAFSVYAGCTVRTPSVDQIILEHTVNFNNAAAMLLYYTSGNKLQAAMHAPTGSDNAAINFSFQPSLDVVGQVMDRSGVTATDKVKIYRNAIAQSGADISSPTLTDVSGPYASDHWYFGARGAAQTFPTALDATDLLIFEAAHLATTVQAVGAILAP